MAKKVRRRVGVVLDYASAKGWRANAAPREQVRALSGKAKKGGNFPAMPYDDVPGYWTHLLGERETVGRLALLFLIATGASSAEVREANWSHVATEPAEWGRPAALTRTSDQDHLVTPT